MTQMKNLQNEVDDQSQVIRRLGWGEAYFDNECMNNNLFMSRIFFSKCKKWPFNNNRNAT